MSKHLIPILLITLLGLLCFLPLLQRPNDVLYSEHSDMLAMHLPMKFFSVAAYQEHGELPLWCPFSFAGMPFVHDVQVAAYYPPHWPLYWLPASVVGAAMSWIVCGHVLIAGWSMYCYARQTKLNSTGALAAAVSWMFAGKWMLHMLEGGHYIMAPLAWLPLVLVALVRATAADKMSTRLLGSVAAGLLFGMMALGSHPQVTFYAGIGIALAMVLQSSLAHDRFSVVRVWLAGGAGMVCAATAVGVAAIQLFPAIEATPHTSRAVGVAPTDILSGGMRTVINFVGPASVTPGPNVRWEDRGGFTVVVLLMATFACSLRRDTQTRVHLSFAAMLIAFALGGAILVQWLPGFRLFRQPTRMLLIASLPVSWLAGAGINALTSAAADHIPRLNRLFARLIAVVGILSGGLAIRSVLSGDILHFHPYWLSLIVTVPTIYWIVQQIGSTRTNWIGRALVTLLAVDVAALAFPSVAVRAPDEIYSEGVITRWLGDNAQLGDRVLERDESPDSLNSPLGTGAPMALLHGIESVRGYNSFDVADYRNYLKRISRDLTPLQPFQDAWTFPLIGNFPLADRSLVDLLGIRYLVQPVDDEVPDGWRSVGISESRPRGYNLIDGGIREMQEYAVYENESALPRAFVVPSAAAKVKANGDIDLDLALEDRADSIRLARIEAYTPNAVRILVDASEAGYLVLADAAYPGWQSDVDGRQVDIVTAHGFFRAVPLDAGRQSIVFRFRPKSLRIGRAVSSITLLAVCLLAWSMRVETRRTTACASQTATSLTSK